LPESVAGSSVESVEQPESVVAKAIPAISALARVFMGFSVV